jgi:hypothetical protein
MWCYTIRCLACKSERVTHPQSIYIGPILDQVIIGSEVTAQGLTCYKTEPLYRGQILVLRCPFCDLVLHIAADLAFHTLRAYLTYAAGELVGLEISRVFKMTDALCTLRAFPMGCPRCAREIDRPNAGRRCVECGDDQVQLIRTEDLPE